MVKFEKVDDWYDERKRKLKIAAIVMTVLGILAAGGYGFYYLRSQSLNVEKSNEEKKIVKKTEKVEVPIDETSIVMIDLKGEVANPGTYRLESSARIQDAIQEAGGLTSKADTSLLNLSKKLRDEMVIIVYSKEQVKEIKKTLQEEEQALTKCPLIDESISNDACITKEEKEPKPSSTTEPESKKISLNNATLEQLMTLPGIGEAKAKLIIAYREAHQGFQFLDELKEIQGIGESIFAKIAENITL